MNHRNKTQEAFGLHLTLDCYGCALESLTNMDTIYQFLDKMPDEIHMTKIMPPYVFKYDAKLPEDSGISGFVLIAESHISVHTFPNRDGYLSLDIFSCNNFDTVKALDLVQDQFKMTKHEAHVFDRGLEFPKAISPVVGILRKERKSMGGRA
jgi:S-adenosylmethionine decarboxylase